MHVLSEGFSVQIEARHADPESAELIPGSSVR